MAKRAPLCLLVAIIAGAAAVESQDTIVVGFERALYTVSEGETANICVEIISPQDIGDSVVYLHVFRNPGGVPDDKIEATPDEDDPLFGTYLMIPSADYPPPLLGAGQISRRPLTQSQRSICYEQGTYQDEEDESDEFFSLQIRSYTLDNLVIDQMRGTTQVRILDDDGVERAMFVSSSSEFFIAFGRNSGSDNVSPKLLISSVEPGPVAVTVETQRGFRVTGFATNNETLEVVLPGSIQLFSSTERDKGIRVSAENDSQIVVYGVNYRHRTTDGFLALPCHDLPVDYYEYFGLSYPEASGFSYNYVIFVACEDNTRIIVGSSTIRLNRMESYYWRGRSVTGNRFISNKPVSVFVGTRCANVPTGQRYCDHLTEQIPPTVTWGTKFISGSLAGRSSGDVYRVLAAQASTTVTVNCSTFDSFVTYDLVQLGSWQEFTTPPMSYCSIMSNKPILVMQYARGYYLSDDVGDPFMMMIIPVEQYSNNYVVYALQEFPTNYITVYVAPKDFEPRDIFVDDVNLENSTWNTVYDSNEICGYITYVALTQGDHRVFHVNTASHVGVSVYGFNTGNSYGYPGGLRVDALQEVPEAECKEGDVRLVSGDVAAEGLVEICVLGAWGTVCDDGWDDNDARIVCQQLGFVGEFAEAFSSARFGSGQGPIHFQNLRCTGDEESLLDCSSDGIGVHRCEHDEDASVMCYQDTGCKEGELRVLGGNATAGRVEICLSGVWGTVCDDSWDIHDARVACRKLGLPSAFPKALTGYIYDEGEAPMILSNLRCNGDEESLNNCTHDGVGRHSCFSSETASVVCSNRQECEHDGQVRLVGGNTVTEGRVEVCYNGTWGVVCDDYWDSNDGKVVCRQLGYSDEIFSVPKYSSFEPARTSVHMHHVYCTGDEESLFECPHNGVGIHDCDIYDDAAVECYNATDCEDGDVRLADGSTTAGTVEVCYGGVWGTVCNTYWDNNDARVVCRQLGLPSAFPKALVSVGSSYYYGEQEEPILMSHLLCNGDEESLNSCPHRRFGQHSCYSGDIAGIMCSNVSECESGQIRLVGEDVATEGRVEVCYNGTWGRVCRDSWGDTDARVVCRQLGYSDQFSKAKRYHSRYGAPSIHLDNLHCTGDEESLFGCRHNGVGIHDCGATDDAGVLCFDDTGCEDGDIRLADGNATAGRVEVCISGIWGVVCDDSWDIHDAKVTCKTLGLPSAYPKAIPGSTYGGDGPKLLGGLLCSGDEDSLIDCPRRDYSCRSYSDVATVVCSNESECESGQVRLVGGYPVTKGRVEVCYNGTWGKVCDGDSWDNNDASVICRQLGFSDQFSEAYTSYSRFSEERPVHLEGVYCTGDEDSLFECRHNGVGVHSCHRFESVAAATCYIDSGCRDGEIRLTGGTATAGRVDICSNGVWAHICQDSWDINDARVACRSMGLPSTFPKAFVGSVYGDRNGPIFMNDVRCNGHEDSLLDCPHEVVGEFSCSSYKHIASLVCSDVSECESGQVRLVGGDVVTEGRVEVCVNRTWGGVCRDVWGDTDAKVICRQLGYSDKFFERVRDGLSYLRTTPIHLDNVHCTGDEESLFQCRHNGVGIHDCRGTDGASAICYIDTGCKAGDVRLADGNATSGRVEVCFSGVWGDVCDTYWDSNDARVICRQLGHPTEFPRAIHGSYRYEEGDGPVMLSELRCNGDEKSLAECSHGGIGQHICSSHDRARIVCSNDTECESGTVRLADGNSTEGYGRVEVCLNGVWGTVCSRLWDTQDATVVCRELGLPFLYPRLHFLTRYGQGDGPIHMANVGCTGDEESIFNCSYNGAESHNECEHYDDTSIQCADAPCDEGWFHCYSYPFYDELPRLECFPNSYLCDSFEHCEDGYDESNCTSVTCKRGYFQCPSDGHLGQCYPSYLTCNGHEECEDGYDEENCTIVVGFTSISYTVIEGVDSFVSVTIKRLRGNINSEVNNITLMTVPGTANAGSDFTPIVDHVVLYGGEVNVTLRISIVNDIDVETAEMFTVSLMSEFLLRFTVDSNYSSAIITIIDNDSDRCLMLGGIPNGSVSVRGTAIAVYSCDQGFELVGDSTRECMNNLTWSGSSPTCRPLCPDLSSPASGVVTQFGNSPGYNATYVCNDGYELVGAPVLNCQNDGTWDNSPPLCRSLCPNRGNPTNGMVTLTGISDGDTATYTCNDGYELVGHQIITCQNGGKWDSAPPICRPMCPTLSNPSNGTVTLSGTPVGDTASYTCFHRFVLTGAPVLTCLSNGMWDNTPPVCIPLCPDVSTPLNGAVSLSGYSEGDTASYTCNDGYELVGPQVITCQSDGTWDRDRPSTCRPVCPTLSDPANGMVTHTGTSIGDTATYTCKDGYELTGAPFLNCQSNRMWDNTPPVCRILCPALGKTANSIVSHTGNSEGDTATYTCNDGYELIGPLIITCQSDGTWNNNPPVCRPLCPILGNPTNGMVTLTGMSVGDTANSICNDGYELIGASVLTCQNDGTWDNTPPVCQSAGVVVSFDATSYTVTEGVDEFAELTLVRSGDLSRTTVVTVTTGPGNATAGVDYVSLREMVNFDIKESRVTINIPIRDDSDVEKDEIFTVLLSGFDGNTFIISDTIVTIIDSDVCHPLENVNNGSVTMSGLKTGDTAVYSCHEGFKLVGQATRVCMSNSTWCGEAPVCRTLCPSSPSVPENVVNVSRPCCGVLKWDAPGECAGDHTYRIRLFSGPTYRTTPSSQRIVLSPNTNSLYFTADNVPSARPLYVIVKARSRGGRFSPSWSTRMVAAETNCP